MTNLKSNKRTVSLKAAAPVAHMVAKRKAAADADATTGKVVKSGGKGKVVKMPQSLEAAAQDKGVFLYTNDSWAQRYFDSNDLYCVERELFG